MKNSLYWAYNLPLQAFPIRKDSEDENSPVVDYRILNYMPRKERCQEFKLSEILDNEPDQTQEEYFLAAAAHLENLANLFKKLAKNEIKHIYYPDEGMDKNNLP